ncbi:MAG: 1,4-dihydroxy-2-naphthoate polyprenyltransferase [Actinobacteria bacterium]|nr:1,4-dihydroxy-2-naphthoate polyprenyltransferase [Actinomycetota bacterium]NBO34950.1 1,4-dihydroxy-2-naphthoate polyprenyltransferase [Actinomycetota bacterium]
MATRNQWIDGARPRTLPAAVAPVLVGTSIAEFEGSFRPVIALLALVVSLALQIGVNYANDYSDGIRGTDENRVGPVRLVGQKLATPNEVQRAAVTAFGISALAGLGMVLLSHVWLLIPIGLAAIAAAWFYTGGAKPYGYAGYGELFVFVFFGLVAVAGTSASQTGQVTGLALLGGIACGALSTAILVANNLRDIPTDKLTGKLTLAVRLGDAKTRELYRACIVIGFFMPLAMNFSETGPESAFIGLFAILSARRPLQAVRNGATGPDLIPVLGDTARVLLLFSGMLSVAIWLSPNGM